MTSKDTVTDTQDNISLPLSPSAFITKRRSDEPLNMSYPGTTASALSNRMKSVLAWIVFWK